MSSNSSSSPLPIPTSPFGSYRGRPRSASIQTQSSYNSSPPPLSPSASPLSTHSETVQTPQLARIPSPSHSPSQSPILSYLFSPSSPVKSPFSTFPFSKTTAPLFEHEEVDEKPNTSTAPPLSRHSRSMSMSSTWANPTRFTSPPANPPPSADQTERGAGLLRRLSLGTFAAKPNMDNNSLGLAGTDTPILDNPTPKGRGRGLRPLVDSKARSPSPMGERMLKGHFDGFL